LSITFLHCADVCCNIVRTKYSEPEKQKRDVFLPIYKDKPKAKYNFAAFGYFCMPFQYDLRKALEAKKLMRKRPRLSQNVASFTGI